MSSELKPCPFCGEKPSIIARPGAVGVKCTCGGKRFIQGYGKNAADAIEQWNTRSLSPDDVEKAAIAAHEYQHIMPWQKITQGRRIMTRERTIASLRSIGFEVQTDGREEIE